MTWSWWYLSFLLIPLALIIPIVMASGWRPSRLSMPSVKTSWSFGGFLKKTLALAFVLWAIIVLGSCAHCAYKKTTDEPTSLVEYPISGDGVATKVVGLRCWLDPSKTYVRPVCSQTTPTPAPARYVFAENLTIFFDDTGPGIDYNSKKWQGMPAGRYFVYPLKDDMIYFRWSQEKEEWAK